MKFSAMLLALALVALAAGGASAGTTVMLNPADPNAAKACTDKGGTVTSDAAGNKFCSLPCPATTGATIAVKLALNDPNAAKACTDACGTVSTDASGQKVCVKPAGAMTPSREPSNNR